MEFCRKKLNCSHSCYGIKNENECLQCLWCHHGSKRQTAKDLCMICYTEQLYAEPCIQLSCGHIFHGGCVEQMLLKKWNGPQITFGFMLCPVCKNPIDHPSLDQLLDPIKLLFEDVKKKALERLQFEGLFKADPIIKPSGSYYKDPAGYAMDRYTYYACYKCGKAYYGGEGRCEHIHDDNFNPEELLCGACVPISRTQECPKHGKEYIAYKCRYCCSLAVFFCFGTTHFCSRCHEKYPVVTGMHASEQLPKCPAGPVGMKLEGTQCPLGIDHPPTGDEYCLGCGICYNLRSF